MNKAALARLATEVRDEIGLTPSEPFDVPRWSALWGVPVLSLAQATDDPVALRRFTVEAPHLWSAALLREGEGHVILYNHVHSPPRILTDLTHEIAHILGEHRLNGSWMDQKGKCGASSEHEREAAELGGALLIPAAAARSHAIRGGAPSGLAMQYGVSEEMAVWRMRESGGTVIRLRRLAKRRA